jgi:EAL domain-containing protein (putative c-di-GMP-specific phosphodiesterase class I)
MICREIADALGFEAVGIAVCDDGRMASLGSVGPLPAALGRDLGELEPYCAASSWSVAEPGTLGAETVLLMPIRSPEGEPVLLWASALHPPAAAWFTDRESLWQETPVLVGAILDAGLVQRRAALTSRAEIERIVAGHRFHSVFQPVIDLETGEAVGYEALTRFDDGTRPDLRFVEAARVGLGAALESACLRSHFAAAEALDRRSWLSVNVAPDTVLAVTPLVSALEGVERDVVLEITEHSAIADYARLIERIRLLGARVRLAVDDAGSGYASLRHVLELSPDIVKLDIALVRGIDADPARQGIVAGLVHFGRQIDCTLIAEGIETEAELATLRRLGVRLGQGFLVGMPERVDAWPAG